MARQYSPKNFLRQAPNSLLREYLARQGIGAEVDWDGLDTSGAEQIFAAITSSAEAAQITCETDFRRVLDMADEAGIRTMVEEGKEHHGIDLAPIFENMSGPLECALWVFLNRAELFTVAERFDYADGLKFSKRGGIPVPREPVSHECVPTLERALSDYYIEQGRGRGCHVDYYRRDDRRCCFCHLEDYAETRREYDDEHILRTERRGKVAPVLDRVYELMKGVIRPIDRQPLASSPHEPRWRNSAQWARNEMVNEGLMVKGSPRGVWEIADRGREYLANNK